MRATSETIKLLTSEHGLIVTEEGRHLVRVPDPALDPAQLAVEVTQRQRPGAHPGQGGHADPEVLSQHQSLQVRRKT